MHTAICNSVRMYYRFLKDIRDKRKYQKALLDGETNMILNDGEVTTVKQLSKDDSQESSKLKLSGSYSIHALYSIMLILYNFTEKKHKEVGFRQQQRNKAKN